jgi:hypothetical protein
LNEVLKEIRKMEEKTAITVRESLLTQWIHVLSLDDDNERIFKGIESLKGRDSDEIKKEFHHLLSQYQDEKEKVKEKVRIEFTEALRKDRIYGSAVEPKIGGSKLWKKEIEKLDNSYRMNLEEIKQQLRGYK